MSDADATWEVVDQAQVRNMAKWKIAVAVDGDVIIWAPRVDLTEDEQERFAQAYVDACRRGAVKRAEAERRAEAHGAVSG